jgi:phage minor structural protein
VVIILIFVLNTKERIVGVLNNSAPLSCPYFSDKHIENLATGVHSYEFSVPASHETAGVLEAEGFVIITDLDDKELEEIGNDSGYIKSVYCEHIAISELLVDVVRPIKLESYTLEQSFTIILDGSLWELGTVDYTESLDVEFGQYVTVLEALHTLMDLYQVEVQYEVVFKNGVLEKRLIHVQKQRGRITHKPFLYGKDLIEVKRTINTEEVISALIGIGKGDASGKQLTLAGFAWGDTSSYYTDFEADYVTSNDLLQRWGVNGKHKFGLYISEKTEPVQLFVDTVEELKRRSTPSNKYECLVITLERITGYEADKVRVGDTAIIHDIEFKPELILEARVIELTRSYTAPENDAVVLGSYKPINLGNFATIDYLQKKIQQKEQLWETTAYKVEIHSWCS